MVLFSCERRSISLTVLVVSTSLACTALYQTGVNLGMKTPWIYQKSDFVIEDLIFVGPSFTSQNAPKHNISGAERTSSHSRILTPSKYRCPLVPPKLGKLPFGNEPYNLRHWPITDNKILKIFEVRYYR